MMTMTALPAFADDAPADATATDAAPTDAPTEEAAAPAPAPELNSGDTAWMLTSMALVLFMTIPGLSLFYGGLVRSKNVLSILMQCFAITAAITVIWVVIGYSIAFDTSGSMNKYVGGFGRVFLKGLAVDSLTLTIPESVFIAFQS
ncbi:MAG: ammonium transporter, partial [Candidatus Hydrogenedentes bacterium]|nr:ammonium transporter [Candidatus Hydrogenedentota bacterium]